MTHPYLPLTDADRQAMFEALGISDISQLFADIPDDVRLKRDLHLPEGLSEAELLKTLQAFAQKNRSTESLIHFLGAGAYDHIIPAVVDAVIARSEFYTAYTPYQPELSQGGLQAMFEFQTMIASLTGMDAATSSHYDAHTALAEATLLSLRESKRKKIALSPALHPESRSVVRAYTAGWDVDMVHVPLRGGMIDLDALEATLKGGDISALLIQYPNFFGLIEPLDKIATLTQGYGSHLIVMSNPLSLALFQSPGAYGADIVCGDMQPLGIPLNFGGPYAGYFTVKERWLRKVPGRIVGETRDERGRRGYVLTLQTREQHIRREKATSNITSNQALMALASAVAMSAFGPEGLKEMAEQNFHKAHYTLAAIEAQTPYRRVYDGLFFNEFLLGLDRPAVDVEQMGLKVGLLPGLPLSRLFPKTEAPEELADQWERLLLIAVTEKRTRVEIDALVAFLKQVANGEHESQIKPQIELEINDEGWRALKNDEAHGTSKQSDEEGQKA